MKDEYKSCINCDNRIGAYDGYARCVATGNYCDISMNYSGQSICSKENSLKYWVPRRPLLHRIFNIYPKDE